MNAQKLNFFFFFQKLKFNVMEISKLSESKQLIKNEKLNPVCLFFDFMLLSWKRP